MELLTLILKRRPGFENLQQDANILEGYAVQFRYPGLSAERSEAKQALVAAERICAFIQSRLIAG